MKQKPKELVFNSRGGGDGNANVAEEPIWDISARVYMGRALIPSSFKLVKYVNPIFYLSIRDFEGSRNQKMEFEPLEFMIFEVK